jgi:ABC-type nickel/cobalt efflux system permease component RcnA
MKKLFSLLAIILFSPLSHVGMALAHPLDISSTAGTLYENRISLITYIHPYQGENFLKSQWKIFNDLSDFYTQKETFSEYITQNVTFKNKGDTCTMSKPEMKEWANYDIFVKWIPLEYYVECSSRIEELSIDIRYFTGFVLQTNRFTLLDSTGREVYYNVGTSKVTLLEYMRDKEQIIIDTDGDGLSDVHEKKYLTDPKKEDTDSDFYYDSEEVLYGWDPLNKWVSPGQVPRYAYGPRLSTPGNSINQMWDTKEKTFTSAPEKDYGISAWAQGWDLFSQILKYLGEKADGIEGTPGFIWLFLMTIALGMFHALGPGHAKTLLTGILLDKSTTRVQWFRFALIFSVTHIIDIIFLYLLLRTSFLVIDAAVVLSFLQKLAPVILIVLGWYLVFTAYRKEEVSSDTTRIEKYSEWKIWILGLVAGIAPCTFGWSIFFLLISMGKISWIPLFVGGVGIWVFLSLILIIICVEKIRQYSYQKVSSLAHYSWVFSWGFILIVGIFLATRVFLS